MNKSELVKIIAKRERISQTTTANVIDSAMQEIARALRKRETVRFVGFGTFKAVEYPARAGRNPNTGVAIEIPKRVRPVFIPGSALKICVNGPTLLRDSRHDDRVVKEYVEDDSSPQSDLF